MAVITKRDAEEAVRAWQARHPGWSLSKTGNDYHAVDPQGNEHIVRPGCLFPE